MAKDLEYYLAQIRRTAQSREKGAEAAIRKQYKTILKDLQHFVSEEYAQYSADDRLTFAMLNQKRRYNRFIEEASKIIEEGLPDTSETIQETVEGVYALCYNGMVSAVKKSNDSEELAEALKGLKAITPQVAKRAVEAPLDKIKLSGTLEQNRKETLFEIRQQLNIGLMNGDRYSTMAKRIVKRMDIDYRKAVRIVRTETHRVQESGFHDSAEELNSTLEKGKTAMRLFKTWNSMEDERVRDNAKANHRRMNGVEIPMDEEFDLGHGVKAKEPGNSGNAANDINCRCFCSYELKEDEETAKLLEEQKSISNPTDDYKKQYEEAAEIDKDVPKLRKERADLYAEQDEHEAQRPKMERIEKKLKGKEELERADFGKLEAEKSEVSKRLEEVTKLAEKFYNKPKRGTSEYEEWRAWKESVDVDEILEEQIKLSERYSKLRNELAKLEALKDGDLEVTAEELKAYKKWASFDEESHKQKVAELNERIQEVTEKATAQRMDAVSKAGKETLSQVKKKQTQITEQYEEKYNKLEERIYKLIDEEEVAEEQQQAYDDALWEFESKADDELWESKEHEMLRKKAQEARDRVNDLAYEREKLAGEQRSLRRERDKKLGEAVREYISEIREVGTDKDLDSYIDLAKPESGDDKRMREVVKRAMQHYPSEWVEKSLGAGKLTVGKVDRGYYSHDSGKLMISGNADERSLRTAFHELGHRFEIVVPHALELETAFYERRTAGEKLVKLRDVSNLNYDESEKTRVDNFLNPYMGKDYSGTAYELMSMGFDTVMTNPEELFSDEDFTEFILGILTLC